MTPDRSPLQLGLQAVRRLFADEAMPLAGNIAFRLLFSVFPFLIFLTAMAGFFGTAEQAEAAVKYLLDVAPEALAKPLAGEITSILTVPRADLLSLAALLTIWSAMAGVDSVRVGLNRAYDLKDSRPGWLIYAIDILFVVASAAAFIVFSFLLVGLPLGLRFAAAHGIDMAGQFSTLEQLRYFIAFILLLASIFAAHLFLPAKRLPLKKIWPGVVLTVFFWAVLTFGFSLWLLEFDSFASTYASLSGVFAAMFFVYLAALALIFGGEFNRVLDVVTTKATEPISQSEIASRSETSP